jgi:glycosyltransferase involved in cell wall biosynthesis
MKYSGVIIAKNEAHIIGECISALLRVTDDIVIILDDASTDDTKQISENLGAKVYVKKWEGYSANKNFGVEKAKNDWILCLDADEVLNDELIDNLIELQKDESCVYLMNIQTYFGEYPVQYCGWFPDWNIRLFNKTKMRWNNNFVHEKLISETLLTEQRVNGLIKHYSFKDEAHMVEKFDYYARLRANEWKKAGKKPPFHKKWVGPYFRFIRTYILKLGILDGKVGFVIANNEYVLKKKELQYFNETQR